MIWPVIQLFLLTFVPFVELRLAIPLGILGGSLTLPFGIVISGLSLHPMYVFLVCISANFMLAVILYIILYYIDGLLRRSFMHGRYAKLRDKSKARLEKFTKKYGAIGLALFIAIPLPGSGVYMGTLGAFVLGLERKKFLIASAIGVTLAGAIVTILTITGMSIF